MERTEMPNLGNGSKGGFEPGLSRLRVRHSTAELPRSTYMVQVNIAQYIADSHVTQVHVALYMYIVQVTNSGAAECIWRG